MKSAVPTARRLLAALETFALQESILVRAGRYAQMAAIQRRAAPLIARLCALGSEPEVAVLRERAAALLARRRENFSRLAERRNSLNAERERLAAKRQSLRRLAAYRQTAAVAGKGRLTSLA